MFVRDCWKPRTEQEILDFIDTYPWALLINNGEAGPFATNLPLMLDRSRKSPVLIGHIAEGNDHARALRSLNTPVLAVFEGPVSYVTASWYPERDMPSTYYYTAVHCYGSLRLQSQPALQRSLELLTEKMEASFPKGWKIDEVPPSEITRRLPYIMGFEIDVQRLEGKFKLGQDEPKKDAMAVARHLAESSDPEQRELSRLIIEYNVGRADR